MGNLFLTEREIQKGYKADVPLWSGVSHYITIHHLGRLKWADTFSWVRYKRGIAVVPLWSGVSHYITIHQLRKSKVGRHFLMSEIQKGKSCCTPIKWCFFVVRLLRLERCASDGSQDRTRTRCIRWLGQLVDVIRFPGSVCSPSDARSPREGNLYLEDILFDNYFTYFFT